MKYITITSQFTSLHSVAPISPQASSSSFRARITNLGFMF